LTLLDIQAVEKSFGNVKAVDGIDFQVDQGTVVGIIGPNGAGKTTFVNLLTGTLGLDGGSIQFDGTDISQQTTYERAGYGLVRSFQIPQVCLDLSVFENVRVAILSREQKNSSLLTSLSSEEESKEEAMRLLEQFDLAHKAEQTVDEITHGDRKILDVCASIAMQPKLIILDEPTSGVASGQQRDMMDQLMTQMRQKGLTVIFISHDMELITDYSDYVMAMSRGQKLVEGEPANVLEQEAVKEQIRGE
jgi:branched-chain amino acid transport system ATP-binding protein